MNVSYNKLWKLLIDENMKKTDLKESCGLSWASISKLSKGKNVSMDILMRICREMECNIGDIVEFIDDKRSSNDNVRGNKKI